MTDDKAAWRVTCDDLEQAREYTQAVIDGIMREDQRPVVAALVAAQLVMLYAQGHDMPDTVGLEMVKQLVLRMRQLYGRENSPKKNKLS
jgi:hypothetical protein